MIITQLVSCNNMQNSRLAGVTGSLVEVCAIMGNYSMFTELNSQRCHILYCLLSFYLCSVQKCIMSQTVIQYNCAFLLI